MYDDRARSVAFDQLNQQVQALDRDCTIVHCLGQRFIGTGMRRHQVLIHGTPGNAWAPYLNGGTLEVFGNAQDAVGDTMNAGSIIVHGSVGDTAGYAMRGGTIYVQGNAGYRAGVHMKAYQDTLPVMVIGGRTGSFLGEYQAGGLILVLGLHQDGKPIASNFPCTGMHGGQAHPPLRLQPPALPTPGDHSSGGRGRAGGDPPLCGRILPAL